MGWIVDSPEDGVIIGGDTPTIKIYTSEPNVVLDPTPEEMRAAFMSLPRKERRKLISAWKRARKKARRAEKRTQEASPV